MCCGSVYSPRCMCCWLCLQVSLPVLLVCLQVTLSVLWLCLQSSLPVLLALSTVLTACVAGSVCSPHCLCCWLCLQVSLPVLLALSTGLTACVAGSVYSPHCLGCGLCPQVSVLGGCDYMIYCQCVIFIIIILIIINCFVCVFFAGRPPCRPVLLAGRCLQLFGPYWLLPSPVLLLAVHGLCARAGLHHELPCGALLQPHPQVV